MGAKRPNQAQTRAGIIAAGPRGPNVRGPMRTPMPPLVARVVGGMVANNNAAFDQSRETAANTVGAVASLVANVIYPGSGGITGAMASSTVRQQYNTFGGRPFFESGEKPWQDWASITAGSVLGGAGALIGPTAGAAASVPTQAGYTGVTASGAAFTGTAPVAAGVGGLQAAAPVATAGAGSVTGYATSAAKFVARQAAGYGINYGNTLIKQRLYGGRESTYRPHPYRQQYIYGR